MDQRLSISILYISKCSQSNKLLDYILRLSSGSILVSNYTETRRPSGTASGVDASQSSEP